MQKPNWPRVIVCGLVAGFVWTVLSIVMLTLVGQEFLNALKEISVGARRQKGIPIEFLANFVAGIWAVWLYGSIRATFGRGLKTAALAGIAWWVIVSQQSAKWIALLGMPANSIWILLAATLPAILISTVAGAWLYERDEKTPRAPIHG